MNTKSKIMVTLVIVFLYCPIASLKASSEPFNQTTTTSVDNLSEPVGL